MLSSFLFGEGEREHYPPGFPFQRDEERVPCPLVPFSREEERMRKSLALCLALPERG